MHCNCLHQLRVNACSHCSKDHIYECCQSNCPSTYSSYHAFITLVRQCQSPTHMSGLPCDQQDPPTNTLPSCSHLILIICAIACTRLAENRDSYRYYIEYACMGLRYFRITCHVYIHWYSHEISGIWPSPLENNIDLWTIKRRIK